MWPYAIMSFNVRVGVEGGVQEIFVCRSDTVHNTKLCGRLT